ncbi:MAG: N-acetylmuramoyl-L-alanine amidase [Verrucomicrobiota bacterium]
MTSPIAICIGHGRPVDQGADSVTGISEESWNTGIAAKLARILGDRGVACQVIGNYQGNTYGSAMRWLATQLARIKATCAIELHFNSSDNPRASGHEWLYCGLSPAGRKLAQCLNKSMQAAFPQLPDRGIKPLTNKDNGWGFVYGTPCPAVICEPGFGSDAFDFELLDDHQETYAIALADALIAWKGGPR